MGERAQSLQEPEVQSEVKPEVQSEVSSELQSEVDELRAQITVNRSDIDQLIDGSVESSERVDGLEGRVDEDRRRIDGLEEAAVVDHELLLELQAAGLVRDELTTQLQLALRTSRRIGAAIGIVMLARKVGEEAAFGLLRTASQNTNRKLRLVADEIVETGDVSLLPAESLGLAEDAEAV
ncbi:ANTAR domain-containing protein [Terrabacter carboxydivorans]|uniref:ANTAR domain-containing protein n=1 Tax=Terrabacter carboxydivorans TaxID=619730 RepID=A0ABN3KXB6_9MICO